MKKYIITKNKINFNTEGFEILSSFDKVIYLYSNIYMSTGKNPVIYYDAETNGLDPYLNDILLQGFILSDKAFVVFPDMIDEMEQFAKQWKTCTLVGQNIKFDYKMLSIQYSNFDVKKFYDTEIADRRIYQGLGVSKDNPMGLLFNLDEVTKRHLPEVTRTGKDIRKQFIGVKKSQYKPTLEQVTYLFDDIIYLPRIVNKQIEKLKQYGNYDFYINYSCPLIKVLSHMELYGGFNLNVDKWRSNIKSNEEILYNKELSMDKERIRLRDTLLTKEQAKPITGGIFDMSRTKFKDQSLDLFGNPIKLPNKFKGKKPINFNYSSDDQLKKLFAHLRLPLPCSNGYAIPIIIDNEIKLSYGGKPSLTYTISIEDKEHIDKIKTIQDLAEYDKHGVIGYETGLTVGIPALNDMINVIPDHPAAEFIKMLSDYSKASTKISNYGENYINMINKVTGKLHTTYRQCHALTGRLQSGGGKKSNMFNSQNVPRLPEYRTCFTGGEDYRIVTCDLSGAETVIMADKAKDDVLYKLAIEQDDIHSPVAQLAWRNIHLYRAGVISFFWKDAKEFWIKKDTFTETFVTPEAYPDWELSQNLVITKEINKHMRTDFKANTFGSVYGMYPKKASVTNGITLDEASILITSVKKMIPKTFEMVEKYVKFGCGVRYKDEFKVKPHGYVPLNKISNNRVYLPAIYRYLKYDIEPEFFEISKAEGICRNAPIQGTQADMVKVAMVNLFNYIKDNNLDAFIMIQVHDELVVKYHKKYVNTKFIYKDKKLTFAELVQSHMVDAANMFLETIQMKADYSDELTWVK